MGLKRAALATMGIVLGGGVIASRTLYRLDRRAASHAWDILLARSLRAVDTFIPGLVGGLPEPARRYLTRAIAPGTRLATAVELEMTGRFGLGDKNRHRMLPMRAREVLVPRQGFVWIPEIGPRLMRMSGSDGYVLGDAWTRFWLLGTIPLVRASGTADLARSAAGRSIMEAIWAPASLLPQHGARWDAVDADTARVTFEVNGEPLSMALSVSADGRPQTISMMRWSDANPEKVFRWQPFGGTIEATGTFEGFTIPARVRVGNHYGTDRYFPFFEAEILSVRYW